MTNNKTRFKKIKYHLTNEALKKIIIQVKSDARKEVLDFIDKQEFQNAHKVGSMISKNDLIKFLEERK
jgi:hypothetical protein